MYGMCVCIYIYICIIQSLLQAVGEGCMGSNATGAETMACVTRLYIYIYIYMYVYMYVYMYYNYKYIWRIPR